MATTDICCFMVAKYCLDSLDLCGSYLLDGYEVVYAYELGLEALRG